MFFPTTRAWVPFVFCLPLNKWNDKSSNSATQLLQPFHKGPLPAIQAAASSHDPALSNIWARRQPCTTGAWYSPRNSPGLHSSGVVLGAPTTRSRAADYRGNAIITALLSALPSKSASDSCGGRPVHRGQKQQLLTHPWLEQKEPG